MYTLNAKCPKPERSLAMKQQTHRTVLVYKKKIAALSAAAQLDLLLLCRRSNLAAGCRAGCNDQLLYRTRNQNRASRQLRLAHNPDKNNTSVDQMVGKNHTDDANSPHRTPDSCIELWCCRCVRWTSPYSLFAKMKRSPRILRTKVTV